MKAAATARQAGRLPMTQPTSAPSFGPDLVILLARGDKRNQARDIKTALRLAHNLEKGSMTRTVRTRDDVAEHLRTPEEMAAYLEACLEEAPGDAAFIAKPLGDIARAKGMAQVARDDGLSRESLYKALSGERSPGFDTILKVIGALGLELHAVAVQVAGSTADPNAAVHARAELSCGGDRLGHDPRYPQRGRRDDRRVPVRRLPGRKSASHAVPQL
jgi:probable addiction module antidote protein